MAVAVASLPEALHDVLAGSSFRVVSDVPSTVPPLSAASSPLDVTTSWDTRGYTDFDAVLRGDFAAPQAIPAWVQTHRKVDWDTKTGHRKRREAPAEFYEIGVTGMYGQAKSSSSTSLPSSLTTTTVPPATCPLSSAAPLGLHGNGIALASSCSSPESSSSAFQAADRATTKRVPLGSACVGPPAFGKPGVLRPRNLKPGEYRPIRRKGERALAPSIGTYRNALAHGFQQDPSHMEQKESAYQIIDSCERIARIIDEATSTSQDYEESSTMKYIQKPCILTYTEEEKEERLEVRERLRKALKGMQKRRQKQDFELKRIEKRFVMHAKHATTVTAIAAGEHDEDFRDKLRNYQMKHSHCAALAALGANQVCRFKILAAFQGRLDLEQKRFRMERQKDKLKSLDDVAEDPDAVDATESQALEQAKIKEYRKLQTDFQIAREKQKELERKRKSELYDNMAPIENRQRIDDDGPMSAEKIVDVADRLGEKANDIQKNEKVAKNFSKLLEFINNGQSSMRKLLAHVNKLDRKEKEAMTRLQEEVEEECVEQVNRMVKTGKVPKDLLKKVREQDQVAVVGSNEIRSLQRRRDRLVAIQSSLQAQIENTAVKQAQEAASAKAYSNALDAGLDPEEAKEHAAKAADLTYERAKEALQSEAMKKALRHENMEKDSADDFSRKAEEMGRKAEEMNLAAAQRLQELDAMQSEMNSSISAMGQRANRASLLAADTQAAMEVRAAVSDGTTAPVATNLQGYCVRSSASSQAHQQVEDMLPQLQNLAKQAEEVVSEIVTGIRAANTGCDEQLLKQLEDSLGVLTTAVGSVTQHGVQGQDSFGKLANLNEAKSPIPEDLISTLQSGFANWANIGSRVGEQLQAIQEPLQTPGPQDSGFDNEQSQLPIESGAKGADSSRKGANGIEERIRRNLEEAAQVEAANAILQARVEELRKQFEELESGAETSDIVQIATKRTKGRKESSDVDQVKPAFAAKRTEEVVAKEEFQEEHKETKQLKSTPNNPEKELASAEEPASSAGVEKKSAENSSDKDDAGVKDYDSLGVEENTLSEVGPFASQKASNVGFEGEQSPMPRMMGSLLPTLSRGEADTYEMVLSETIEGVAAPVAGEARAAAHHLQGLQLFKKAAKKVIQQNNDEKQASAGMGDICAEKRAFICKESGITEKDLLKEKTRSALRLQLQRQLKQCKKQLWLRTKVLVSFLSPEEVTSMQKAGLIAVQSKPGEKLKESGDQSFEAEEKRLKQRLQMLVNLINFWSRRIEQAGLFADDGDIIPGQQGYADSSHHQGGHDAHNSNEDHCHEHVDPYRAYPHGYQGNMSSMMAGKAGTGISNGFGGKLGYGGKGNSGRGNAWQMKGGKGISQEGHLYHDHPGYGQHDLGEEFVAPGHGRQVGKYSMTHLQKAKLWHDPFHQGGDPVFHDQMDPRSYQGQGIGGKGDEKSLRQSHMHAGSLYFEYEEHMQSQGKHTFRHKSAKASRKGGHPAPRAQEELFSSGLGIMGARVAVDNPERTSSLDILSAHSKQMLTPRDVSGVMVHAQNHKGKRYRKSVVASSVHSIDKLDLRSHTPPETVGTDMTLGGPSSEQVAVTERFVTEILGTSKLPLAKDSILSSMCLWLEVAERKAIISHLWRVFSHPEPVQRNALKALASGRVGENSPLKHFKKDGQAGGANKLLNVASAIARRLCVLIEHVHHHQSDHGSTWTGTHREDMHHHAEARNGTSLLSGQPGDHGLRRGHPRSSILDGKSSSTMLHPDLSDLIKSHGGQPLSNCDLKALVSSPRTHEDGRRGALKREGAGTSGRRVSLTNPDVMRERVQEAAKEAQARLAEAASLVIEVAKEKGEVDKGAVDVDEKPADVDQRPADKAHAAWAKMKKSVRHKAIIQSFLCRNRPTLQIKQAAETSVRDRAKSNASALCVDLTSHLDRMASKERQALSYLYKENSRLSRSMSQPSLYSAANLAPSALVQAGRGARTSWKRRGSVSGPWTDDLTEQWKEITRQVRQEKKEIYREYKQRQIQGGGETKAERRTSSAIGDAISKPRVKTSIDLGKLQEEDNDGDDEALPNKANDTEMLQHDLLKLRNENKDLSDDGNTAKGNVNYKLGTLFKSVSKFKRAAHKRSGYDDGVITSDIQVNARLKSIRIKKKTLIGSETAESAKKRGLDYIWGVPHDSKADIKESSEDSSSSSESSASEEYVDESGLEGDEKRRASLLKEGLGALGWKKVKIAANATTFVRRAAVLQEKADAIEESAEKIDIEKVLDSSPSSPKSNPLFLFEESTPPAGRSRSPAPSSWNVRGQKNWVQALQNLKGTSPRAVQRSSSPAANRFPRKLVNGIGENHADISIQKKAENGEFDKFQATASPTASPRGVRRRGQLAGKSKAVGRFSMREGTFMHASMKPCSSPLAVDTSPKQKDTVNNQRVQELDVQKDKVRIATLGRSLSEDALVGSNNKRSDVEQRLDIMGASASAPALLNLPTAAQVGVVRGQPLSVVASPARSRTQSPDPIGKGKALILSRQPSPQPPDTGLLKVDAGKSDEQREASASPSRYPSTSPTSRKPSKRVIADGWHETVLVGKSIEGAPPKKPSEESSTRQLDNAEFDAPQREKSESISPRKGVLDPESLVGLPIEVIHSEIRNNLMLFNRRRSPQEEATGDDFRTQAKVKEVARPFPHGAYVAHVPHMMRPSSWGKVTHALTSSSHLQSNLRFSGQTNSAVCHASAGLVQNASPRMGAIIPPPVSLLSPATGPLCPRFPAEPSPPPSYHKAAKHGNQLTPAIQILNRYLVDFACDDVEDLFKAARQTATQGVELPVLSPMASPRKSGDPFLSPTSSPRKKNFAKKMSEDPQLDSGRYLKLPSIDAKTAGHVASTGLTSAEQRELDSVRKSIEKRLQKIEACAARADEAERAERRHNPQRSTTQQGLSPKAPRNTPRAEFLK